MFPTSFSRTAETQPLLRPLASETVGSLCFISVLSGLAVAWCILDQWNHEVSDSLFQLGDLRSIGAEINETPQGLFLVPKVETPFKAFVYPLTLAFFQFLFMGMLFMGLYLTLFHDSRTIWANLRITSDKRWPALVLTHIFSMFFLQALMLPKQALSLGLFAATRAVEIPVAAMLRIPVCEKRFGRHTLLTLSLATAAVCTLYFAYVQVSGCLCVWTGHGVMLTGFAFWLIYLLILALPAANLVCQEGILILREAHPLLMLGLQNIFAAAVFLPVLMLAWIAGWEDVRSGMIMIVTVNEVTMLIGWLCLQMAAISLVSALLIKVSGSFWAVALQALRVVWWWLRQLWMFYNTAPGRNALVSISCPHASVWSFVMLCGFCLAVAAVYSDRRAEDTIRRKPQQSKTDGHP